MVAVDDSHFSVSVLLASTGWRYPHYHIALKATERY